MKKYNEKFKVDFNFYIFNFLNFNFNIYTKSLNHQTVRFI